MLILNNPWSRFYLVIRSLFGISDSSNSRYSRIPFIGERIDSWSWLVRFEKLTVETFTAALISKVIQVERSIHFCIAPGDNQISILYPLIPRKILFRVFDQWSRSTSAPFSSFLQQNPRGLILRIEISNFNFRNSSKRIKFKRSINSSVYICVNSKSN